MKKSASSPPHIKIVHFQGIKRGPAILVFGAIHGNETCGTQAIHKIMSHIESGSITLQKGSVTFVPVANPLAYACNKRYVKENLNRIFKPTRNPSSDEAHFANILCPLIDACDVFLDIHSITAEGQPFLYLDFPTPRNRAWSKVMPVRQAIVGWPELYRRMGLSHTARTTPDYAASKGKDALLIECGQHQDKNSPKIAYDAILSTLHHYKLVKDRPKKRQMTSIVMSAGFFRQSATERHARKWQHLDRVKKGQALITRGNGSIIPAPHDGVVIMPKANAATGEDWLYFGKPKKI